MKVFIGTENVANAHALLRQGFREIGIEADVGLLSQAHKFYGKIENNDVDIRTIFSSTSMHFGSDGSLKASSPPGFRELPSIMIFLYLSHHIQFYRNFVILRYYGGWGKQLSVIRQAARCAMT